MKIRYLKDLVFQDYKKPSMLIGVCRCDWKCCVEGGFNKSICQNYSLRETFPIKDIENNIIIDRYLKNPLTKSIIFGGLEPFLQIDEILSFIQEFRKFSQDDIVIYSGYYPYEIEKENIKQLKSFKNIIIKWGRYIPNRPKKYDNILGIYLASDNQYAEKI